MTPHHPTGIGSVKPEGWVYSRAPMIVYWELTTACGLACRHCRATAMPDAAPGQLSTRECLSVLDDIATFGRPLPHIVFTGGDPLRRPDLDLLIRAAGDRGIGASLAPAVTPDLTFERLAEVQRAGIQAISLSLDGSDPFRHDGLRGVPGTFDLTMTALDWAAELGLPVQVNTLVTDVTAADLPAMYELLSTKKLLRWSLFFLISVGRGSTLGDGARGCRATDALAVRPRQGGAVPGQDHRGDALPARGGPTHAPRGPDRGADRGQQRRPRVRHPRRQRDRLHRPGRRREPVRVPAPSPGQRP